MLRHSRAAIVTTLDIDTVIYHTVSLILLRHTPTLPLGLLDAVMEHIPYCHYTSHAAIIFIVSHYSVAALSFRSSCFAHFAADAVSQYIPGGRRCRWLSGYRHYAAILAAIHAFSS